VLNPQQFGRADLTSLCDVLGFGLTKPPSSLRVGPTDPKPANGKFFLVVNDVTPDDPKGERGPYLSPEQAKAFKGELRDFPLVGLYKDQVDCTADAVNYNLKLFLKGRVVKVDGHSNVLSWDRFMHRFGPRIPGHWEVAIAARFGANKTLPSGWAMLARAGENANLGETVFVVASTRKYVSDPGIILTDIKDAVKLYLEKGEQQVQAIYVAQGNNEVIALAQEKHNVVLHEFEGSEEMGLNETAWYFHPLKTPNPFYSANELHDIDGRQASRCYILSDDDQVDNARDDRGQLSLLQDVLHWSYNDQGKPQPFGGIVLDCVRVTLYNFSLSATGLSEEERIYAKLPLHLQPEAIAAKRGTEECVVDFMAQRLAIGQIYEEERERERELEDEPRPHRFSRPSRQTRFRRF
jgi:hypothetical protein